MSTVDASTVTADTLRTTLVALVPEWEKRYGVAPFITAAVSEYDAARLVGHTPETFFAGLRGSHGSYSRHGLLLQRSSVSDQSLSAQRKTRFVHYLGAKSNELRMGSTGLASVCGEFQLLEAWEWYVADYQSSFDTIKRLSPAHMRTGRRLHARV